VTINYDHAANRHTVVGAAKALKVLLEEHRPCSILDVGCGIGTWLRAALNEGIDDVLGVDGVDLAPSRFLIPISQFFRHDLTQPLDVRRRFDLAICLEVAEHLPAAVAGTLIQSLTKHSNTILFSAACPGQLGQHHINCQWPEYWQNLFNDFGYACDDGFRWRIWETVEIEPWYRQNSFIAKRDSTLAGTEPRIMPVVHPDILSGKHFNLQRETKTCISEIESEARSVSWYRSLLLKAIAIAATYRRKFLTTKLGRSW
jgi:SAM-dependent methyltransferase